MLYGIAALGYLLAWASLYIAGRYQTKAKLAEE